MLFDPTTYGPRINAVQQGNTRLQELLEQRERDAEKKAKEDRRRQQILQFGSIVPAAALGGIGKELGERAYGGISNIFSSTPAPVTTTANTGAAVPQVTSQAAPSVAASAPSAVSGASSIGTGASGALSSGLPPAAPAASAAPGAFTGGAQAGAQFGGVNAASNGLINPAVNVGAGAAPTVAPGLFTAGGGVQNGIVNQLGHAAGGYVPLAGAALAAGQTAYNIFDAFNRDFDKTDTKENLFKLRGPQFWASVFGGGKDRFQQGRDSARSFFRDNFEGFVDDDWNVTLADGAKYDIGKDGDSDLYLFSDKEIQDEETVQVAQALEPLAVMKLGDSRQADEFQTIFTRAAMSSGDWKANVRKMYEDVGMNRDEAYEFILESNIFDDKEKDAYLAALDRAFEIG